jgi:hypothetical protein
MNYCQSQKKNVLRCIIIRNYLVIYEKPNISNFREFTVSYRVIDGYGAESFYFLVSDWDLDAAFIR